MSAVCFCALAVYKWMATASKKISVIGDANLIAFIKFLGKLGVEDSTQPVHQISFGHSDPNADRTMPN